MKEQERKSEPKSNTFENIVYAQNLIVVSLIDARIANLTYRNLYVTYNKPLHETFF